MAIEAGTEIDSDERSELESFVCSFNSYFRHWGVGDECRDL